MTSAHLIISGFVQGVGFRQFIKSHAKKLELNGWVKNTSDGSVEALFQGEKKLIKNMILLCGKGPFLAEVENIEVKWEETSEQFQTFTILHTP